MASAHKKVIIRRFVGDVLPGYLAVGSFVQGNSIALLDLHGHLSPIVLSDVKYISYVRDFNLHDSVNPERLTRRAFLARPRSEGLWVRVTFRTPTSASADPRSPDLLEGLAPTDTSLLDDLLNDTGLYLTPPDTRSNTQRIFIPRSAIAELAILAVITTPSRRKPVTAPPATSIQDDLFSLPQPPSAHPN